MKGLIVRFHDTLPETARGADALKAQTGYAIVTETYLVNHAKDQYLAGLESSQS